MPSSDPLAPIRDLENNASYLEQLRVQVNNPQGIVPFVGAGLSVPFGYPGWRRFLLEQA